MNTKAVDEVNNFSTGVVFPVLMPFFGRNQPFEDAANNLIVNLGEIELVYLVNKLAPVGRSAIRIKRDSVLDGLVVFSEDCLIIAGNVLGFGEVRLQVKSKLVSGFDVLWDGKAVQSSPVAPQERFMEDQLID